MSTRLGPSVIGPSPGLSFVAKQPTKAHRCKIPISFDDVIQSCKEAGVDPFKIGVVGQQLAVKEAMIALESAKHRVLASLARRIALTEALVHDGPGIIELRVCANLMPWDGKPQDYGQAAVVQPCRDGRFTSPRLEPIANIEARDTDPFATPDPNVYPDVAVTAEEYGREHKNPNNRRHKAV